MRLQHMSRVTTALHHILTNPRLFSDLVIDFSLHSYQLGPILALVDSVLNRRGHEFLIIMPRQCGKNEAVAHLLVHLLNIFQRASGNVVYGAIGDDLGRGIGRLEERLDNIWNIGRWSRSTNHSVALLANPPASSSAPIPAPSLVVKPLTTCSLLTSSRTGTATI